MNYLKKTIMKRDNLSEKEADDRIANAKAAFDEYLSCGDEESAYNICDEFFGLEPDYLINLID